MNIHKKVYAQDVLDHLIENGTVTIAALSSEFDVTSETIRKR